MENERVERVEPVEQETIKMEEKSRLESPRGAPLSEVIGAVISLGVLGFWFGVGVASDAKMVNNLEELISR